MAVKECKKFETKLLKENKEIISILLKDNTTNKNIVWGTDNYLNRGIEVDDEILLDQVMHKRIIRTRSQKAKDEQQKRSKQKAEVFTPSWICNKMNNHCDTEWFGRENVFNTELEKSWESNKHRIKFPEDKNWKDYVNSKKLEITCGEAPYIVSRYDASTGKDIAIKNRIGFLDRKLRVINENAETERTWLIWAKKAFQSVYGYEFQGDNLFIARMNLLSTYIEYMDNRWKRMPTGKELKEIANIISWNIWQMEGIKGNVPYGPKEEQIDFLKSKENINCNIYDWENKKIVSYNELTS